VHVPYVPEQVRGRAGVASLPLSTLVEGVRILLNTAWHHQGADAHLAAGAES
jgi:pyrrolidone-carboxylate peptidase